MALTVQTQQILKDVHTHRKHWNMDPCHRSAYCGEGNHDSDLNRLP